MERKYIKAKRALPIKTTVIQMKDKIFDLRRFISQRKLNEFEKCLKSEPYLDMQEHNLSLIHHAVLEDAFKAQIGVVGTEYMQMIQLLLDVKADINERDNLQLTPLFQAGRVEMMTYLLQKGADATETIPSMKHMSVLMHHCSLHCMDETKPKMLKLLLEHKADLNLDDNNGDSVLHYFQFGSTEDNALSSFYFISDSWKSSLLSLLSICMTPDPSKVIVSYLMVTLHDTSFFRIRKCA